MKPLRALVTVVAAASLVTALAATPAQAQFICGNDVGDPCTSYTDGYSSYAAADIARLQLEIYLRDQLGHTILSTRVEYLIAYVGVVYSIDN